MLRDATKHTKREETTLITDDDWSKVSLKRKGVNSFDETKRGQKFRRNEKRFLVSMNEKG